MSVPLSEMSEAQLFSLLSEKMKHPEEKLRDTLSLPEPIRSEVLAEMLESDVDWVQRPDYRAEIVSIVTAIAAVAGGVGTIASAGSAVAALAKSV